MIDSYSRIMTESEEVKKQFQRGDMIEIIQMLGEPQYAGKTGTVTSVDDAGQVHGTWGGCALIPGVDSFRKI